MDICLITPPSSFLLDERIFVSLGILKVAASLEHAGHHVEHLDLSGIKNYEDAVRDYCRETDIRTFGLTATSPQMPAALKVAKTIRGELPASKTILGGPHATLVNAAAKLGSKTGNVRAAASFSVLRSAFDAIVAGDGERGIFRALSMPGITDADDPRSEYWLSSADFTASPWPARHLVVVESYHYSIEGERALSVIGQLGCPYMCAFCAGRNSPFLRRIRLRTPADVVNEICHLYETYGVKGFMAYDDELNVNKAFLPMLQLLREAAAYRGIEWRLRGFLKAELFTDEQAAAMYQAGFRQVLIGFESGSERILTNIQKKATQAENTRAIEIAHKHGLKVKALMSIGHAGESEQTILETRDWLLRVTPDDFDLTIITPYPGSPYYDDAKLLSDGTYCYTAKNGDRLYMAEVDFTGEAYYYKGAPGQYTSFVWTDHITPKRLVEMRDEIESEVRHKLCISFNASAAALQYDASMGMSKILRTSQQSIACKS